MPRWAIIVVATVSGSLLASFLRLVWDRRLTRHSVVALPSCCPMCRTRIRGVDLLPVIGWLWLRGRCRHCQTKIGTSHLTGEVAGALIGCALAVWVT